MHPGFAARSGPLRGRTSAPLRHLRRRSAFTVLELIIVISIVAIIATLAYPRVNFTQFQVDGGARLVRITLQNAQRLAVTRQFNVVVSFDVANSRMRVLEDNNDNAQADAGERVTSANLEDGVHFGTPPAGFSGPVTDAVFGGNIKTVDGLPSITFRRDGAASSDLELYLTSRRAEGNDWRGIQVVQSTGRSDWFKYIDAIWKQGNL